MRFLFILCLLIFPVFLFSQKNDTIIRIGGNSKEISKKKKKKTEATIDLYRYISLERDTTYVDTSMNIRKEYSHNYLRKDNFGLLEFSNVGQTYNTLYYGLIDYSPMPEFGFLAKSFDYLKGYQIKYSSVATPVSEIYYRSAIGKGQMADSYFSINPMKQLNLSIEYKGVRSLGDYVNQRTSSGNLTLTSTFTSDKNRYIANFHFALHDILNQENGGILNISNFKGGTEVFKNRQALEVFLKDASSFLKGNRLFLDHTYRLNPQEGNNKISIKHQFEYETKTFVYSQNSLTPVSGNSLTYHFGNSYKTAGIRDHTNYDKIYNKIGVEYENNIFGRFRFSVDNFSSNYIYNKVLILDKETILPLSRREISNLIGEYKIDKKYFQGKAYLAKSLTNQNLFHFDAEAKLILLEKYELSARYQNLNKLPNDNYQLYQSSYVSYNWSNSFKNEKINNINTSIKTPWINFEANYSVLEDHLYFNDISTAAQKQSRIVIVAPSQYGNSINYFSLKANNEFRVGRFALENTLLYQEVSQKDKVLNVPTFVSRNSLYYTDSFFKKALNLQIGFILNYFTSYYANEYNPVIGEFFSQKDQKIGDFPLMDFFINARIQRTRVYIKAEHFNSYFSGYDYFSSPNTPFRDYQFRFGFVWNFFE